MNTIRVPDAFSDSMMLKKSSISCGVRTAVGSSNTTISASRNSTLRISTRCWMPTGRFSIERVGIEVESVPLGVLLDLPARRAAIELAHETGRLDAEHHVLGDVEHRHEHEVLVHHPDPGGDGVAAVR